MNNEENMIKKMTFLLAILSILLFANDDKYKTFKIRNSDIEITIIYPKHIVQGDRVRLIGVMKNRYRNAHMGGLTISFPQFKYTKGIYSDNTFDTINSYSPPDKIYSGIAKKNIRSKYYMIEGWENNWKSRLEKKFYIEVDIPNHVNHLTINVRGVLIFGKSKQRRTEIKLPVTNNYKDQQGYPVGRLSIPIYQDTQQKTEKNILPPTKKKESSTGTGFFINSTNIITNQHVVDSCRNIKIIKNGITSSAKIKSVDRTNDLAVLIANEPSKTYLKFRSGRSVRIGESIIAMGYPLGGLLGTSVKLTTGNISSLTGLLNDTTTLQLTAPVQPGNSGGPLLDNTGSIVGVVYAKLAEKYSAENVNLAIKANVATIFLDVHEIDYTFDTDRSKKEVVDIADNAKKSIIQIICE